MFINQKGFAHLFLTLFLLAGIGIGVYLVQNPQIFNPKASEVLSVDSTEFGSTPISEVDLYPKPTNGIQTMIYFIFHSDPNLNPLSPDKPYAKYVAKEVDYVWFDQGSIASCYIASPASCTFDNLFLHMKELNRLNPKIKLGTHAGAVGAAANYHISNNFLNDSDFLHKTDGSRYMWANDVYFINLSSAETRQKIANGWKQVFEQHPYLTGINLDSYTTYDGWFTQPCRETDCNTENFWLPSIKDLSQKIKTAAPAGKDITYNGIGFGNKANGGVLNSGFVDNNDGALSEWSFEMLVSADTFKKYIETYTAITAKNKKVFMWVMPEIFKYSYNNDFLQKNNIQIDLNMERFYLASYLLIQKNPLTYFGFQPGAGYDSSKGIYFYKDWNMDYGSPKTNWTTTANGLYTREYSNGIVAVNPYAPGEGGNNGARDLTLPANQQYQEWDNVTPLLSGTVSIPPRSGKFYFKALALKAAYGGDIPVNWAAGQPQTLEIKVTNLGTETWKKDGPNPFHMGTYTGGDADEWVGSKTASFGVLSSDLAPGQSQNVPVTIATPATPGNYKLRIKFVKQGIAWFDQLLVKDITVYSGTPPASVSVFPNCSDRPQITKNSVMTPQGLKVSIAVNNSSTITDNNLKQIAFTKLTNATVKIGNNFYLKPETYIVPPNTTSVEFLINQAVSGSSTNVELKIVDKCGDNSQFFGGGNNMSWPSPVPSPTPVPTPSPTPTPTPTPRPTPPPHPLASGIVSYWKFNETSGIPKDSSTGGTSGSSSPSLSFTPGKLGNALTNSGAGGGLTIPYAAGSGLDISGNKPMTVAFWLKVNSLQTHARLIQAGGCGAWGVFYLNDGQFGINNFCLNSVLWPAGTVKADNIWHQFVITYDGTNARLYKDNVLVGTKPYTPNWSSSARSLYISGDPAPGLPLRGSIDELGIWNKALTVTEINSLYNNGQGITLF